MTCVSIIDVHGMTAEEYRRIMDALGVEEHPEPGIYLHITAKMDFGYRVVEVWDDAANFQDFMTRRLAPAAQAARVEREMEVEVVPLHNYFAPRELGEEVISVLPGVLRKRVAAAR